MASATLPEASQAKPLDEELLVVPISSIVRADFRRRGVFPELCEEPAKAGRHLAQLTHAQARALIEDLSTADRPAPWPECKGIVLARTALRRNIEEHFQSEQRCAERKRDAERASAARQREDGLKLLVGLRWMPKTHAAYRDKTIEDLRFDLKFFVEHHMQASESHGFRYSPEVIDDFTAGLEELVELLSDGVTLYDESRQRAAVNSLVGESAKKDVALQRLLCSSMTGPQRRSLRSMTNCARLPKQADRPVRRA